MGKKEELSLIYFRDGKIKAQGRYPGPKQACEQNTRFLYSHLMPFTAFYFQYLVELFLESHQVK